MANGNNRAALEEVLFGKKRKNTSPFQPIVPGQTDIFEPGFFPSRRFEATFEPPPQRQTLPSQAPQTFKGQFVTREQAQRDAKSLFDQFLGGNLNFSDFQSRLMDPSLLGDTRSLQSFFPTFDITPEFLGVDPSAFRNRTLQDILGIELPEPGAAQQLTLEDLNRLLLDQINQSLTDPNAALSDFLDFDFRQDLPFSDDMEQLIKIAVLNLLNPGEPPGGQETFEDLVRRLSEGGPRSPLSPEFTQELMNRFQSPGLSFDDTQRNLAEFLSQSTQFGQGLTQEEVDAQTELLLTPLRRARELASQDLKAQAAARGLTSGDAPIQERFARLDEELARQAGALAQQQLLEDFGLRRAAAELDLQRSQALANLIQGRQQLDTSTKLSVINELGRSLRGEEERDLQRENLLINTLLPERARRDAQSLEAYRLVADFILGERRLSAGQQQEVMELAMQLRLGNTSAGIELARLLNSRDLAEIALNREDARALGGFILDLILGGVGLANKFGLFGDLFGGGPSDVSDIFQGPADLPPNGRGGGPLFLPNINILDILGIPPIENLPPGFDPFGRQGPNFDNPLIRNIFDASLTDEELLRRFFG